MRVISVTFIRARMLDIRVFLVDSPIYLFPIEKPQNVRNYYYAIPIMYSHRSHAMMHTQLALVILMVKSTVGYV